MAGQELVNVSPHPRPASETVRTMRESDLRDMLEQAKAAGERLAEKRAGKMLEAVTATHAAELERHEQKALAQAATAHAHGFHKGAWVAGLVGAVAAGGAVFAIMVGSQAANFRAAQEATQAGVVTGMVRQTVTPLETCIPGGTREDGSPCNGGTRGRP